MANELNNLETMTHKYKAISKLRYRKGP